MSNLSTSYLVVGVDGSPPADEALAFAFAEAARCGDEVRVVTSCHREPITTGLPMIPIPVPPDDTELRAFAEEAQAQALSRALGDGNAPVALTRSVVQGEPGPALVEASQGARLLVVGSRALGPVRAALLGSVSALRRAARDLPRGRGARSPPA